MPVPTIWLSAPSSSHGQNAGVGHGTASPVAAITTAKKISENGKPNRKRILVAPQVPSGAVNCRCIALRATWPSAATMVKGIQSVAMPSMWDRGLAGLKLRPPCRCGCARSTVRIACGTNHSIVPANVFAGTTKTWPTDLKFQFKPPPPPPCSSRPCRRRCSSGRRTGCRPRRPAR